MNDIIIDFAPQENCWNQYEAYYNCIGCGCCAKDREERTRNRLKVLNRLLNERQDMLDSENEYQLSYNQKRNIKADIQYFKRKIRYYEKVLNEVQNEKDVGKV